MDIDAERKKLEDQQAFIQSWLEHPITQETTQDNSEQQQALVDLICNRPIDSFGSFFAHFEAVGELRGLRRAKGITQDSLESVKRELKELEN